MEIVVKDVDVVSDVNSSDGVRFVFVNYFDYRRGESTSATTTATSPSSAPSSNNVSGRLVTACLKYENNQWTWLCIANTKIATDDRARAAFGIATPTESQQQQQHPPLPAKKGSRASLVNNNTTASTANVTAAAVESSEASLPLPVRAICLFGNINHSNLLMFCKNIVVYLDWLGTTY